MSWHTRDPAGGPAVWAPSRGLLAPEPGCGHFMTQRNIRFEIQGTDLNTHTDDFYYLVGGILEPLYTACGEARRQCHGLETY